MVMPLSYTDVSRILLVEPKIGSASTVTSAQLYALAEDAESEISAQVSRYYDLPFAAAPPLLRSIATNLSIYYALRRLFTEEKLKDSAWPRTFREANKTLERIGLGEIMLTDSSGQIIAARSDNAGAWSDKMEYNPTFTELGPEQSYIDSSKIDDLKSSRGIE